MELFELDNLNNLQELLDIALAPIFRRPAQVLGHYPLLHFGHLLLVVADVFWGEDDDVLVLVVVDQAQRQWEKGFENKKFWGEKKNVSFCFFLFFFVENP